MYLCCVIELATMRRTTFSVYTMWLGQHARPTALLHGMCRRLGLTPGCQLSIQEWKAMKSMSGEAWSATASCPVSGTQLTHPAACNQDSMAYHVTVAGYNELWGV